MILSVVLLTVTAVMAQPVEIGMSMKKQITTDLLGSISFVNYVVGFIFVALALVFKWCLKTVDSIKNNPKTPSQWDWKFWRSENLKAKLLTLIAVIIAVFLCFRFATEKFGVTFTYFFALGVGLGLDYYIDSIRKQQPATSQGN